MSVPAGIAATAGERVAVGRTAGVGVLRTPWIAWLGIPPVAFYALLAALLAVLVLYPFAVLLTSSFFTGQPGRLGSFTLANYAVWLGSWDLLPIILNSMIFSASRLAIALFFALLFAWAVARTNVPFAGLMGWMIPIPFFIPDLLTGFGWLMLGNPQNGMINQLAQQLFGIQGPIINLYGWGGLIFHASLNTISFMFLMLVGFFKQMDASYEEAAITLGASKLKVMLTITFPMLAPAILSISLLVFIHGLESFENPLLFGNPGGVYVFANEIYRMLSYRHPPEYGAATALSVILILVTFALLVVQWRKLGGRRFTVVTGKGYRPTRLRLPGVLRWSIFALFVVYFLLAVVIPIAQIVFNSFFEIFGLYGWQYVTVKNWSNVLNNGRALNGLKNTIIYATIAAFAVVVIGGLVGYIRVRTRHWLGYALELMAWAPWTLPGVVMGLALLWAWALPPQPFNLYGTALVIIIGFIVKGLPLGAATMQSAVHQISPELEESSRVHGGSWLRTVRHILAPLLRRGALAAFVIVFAISARDLTIPLLLYRDDTETLTVTLLHYYETGDMGTLAATSLIQLALVMMLLALDSMTRGKDD
jgi:iron(III) transport system permease protein